MAANDAEQLSRARRAEDRHRRDVDQLLAPNGAGAADDELRRAAEVLERPARLHVEGLEARAAEASRLADRATDLFAVIAARKTTELLSKTETAERAGIVAGAVTLVLAGVGLFASLAGVPRGKQNENLFAPSREALALSVVALVAAAAFGYALSRALKAPVAPKSKLHRTLTSLRLPLGLVGAVCLAALAFVDRGAAAVLAVVGFTLVLAAIFATALTVNILDREGADVEPPTSS